MRPLTEEQKALAAEHADVPHKAAWKVARERGLDPDDLYGMAALLFLAAVSRWDASRGGAARRRDYLFYCTLISLRSRSPRPRPRADVDDAAAVPARGGPDAEALDFAAWAMRQLPEADRRIVELEFWGGLTRREIAAAVGMAHQSVSERLGKALARLRNLSRED